MKNKAIILDLDGTVVDSPLQKLPSKRLVKALRKLQKDYFICSATGRVWSFAQPLLKALKLIDPCVISAGTQICDPVTGKILWQKTIDEEVLRRVIKLLRKYPDWKLLYNDGTEDDYFNGGAYPNDFIADEPVYFLEQVFIPDTTAQEIYQKLGKVKGITCVMVTAQKPGCRDLHIVNSEATKEQALAKLLKMIKVDRKNSIGVGDGSNDIHLFNAVEYRVAMGNAVEDLKNMADEVIGNVEKDGLVDYFDKLAAK